MTSFNPRLTGKVILTGTRFAAGTRGNNGRYTKGATSPLSFTGNHQPLTDADLLLLPEGEREKKVRKIYTTFALRPASVNGQTSADHVVIDGETFEVFRVKTYNMGVLDHHKVIAIRLDQ